MAWWRKLRFWAGEPAPRNLSRGNLGERAAKDFLRQKGMKFLTANFLSRRGEIDLVFRDGECLVFVEVKARSSGGWTRPARAVNARKRLALARAAQQYLRRLRNPLVPYRFDIVEVLLERGAVREIRHIPNGFATERAR